MWAVKNMVNKNHDVTLISSKGSSRNAEEQSLPSNLNLIETIEPSWEGTLAEKAHYLMYKKILEKEYGNGNGIVWDNTWHCFSYLSAKKFPKMKIIHTHHGIVVEGQESRFKRIQFPRYIGLSSLHAQYLENILDIPVRYVHHGIPLPALEKTKNNEKGDYLLSINRIVREKGIDDSIDLALKTGNAIKIVGDDIHVGDISYVQLIKEKCKKSNGLAEYIGLVDNKIKIDLIKKCKAVIACPKSNWIEAFGLYAVEANSYGKPALAIENGGLKDIIINEINGFLAKTPQELQKYIDRVDECSPTSCRRRVEKYFTDEIMTENYLKIFNSVINDEVASRW